MSSRPRLTLSAAVLALSLTCGFSAFSPAVSAADNTPVTVASKIDTEGSLLGNLIKLTLQAHGVTVNDKIGLGSTPIVRKALVSGEIDVYPEYTGNAAFFYNKAADPAWKDPAKSYQEARALDAPQHLIWLAPAPADNTWGIAVTADVANAHKLKTLDDFAKWVSTAGNNAKLAASAEFVNSASALPSFEKAYHFDLKQSQLIVLSGGDTAATIKAAAEQTNGVNAAMVYGTDGGIAAAGLVVLADSKHVQPVYAPAPVIRASVLQAHPQIAEWLKPVFAGLDLKTLQALNARIQLNGEPAEAVAAAYLKAKGLSK
ncbi:ABC transporter substrate-binding protein [Robbsia sp. KACC 23696]|uniref:glycine betaine ABC transporter substrate-binding protein OsmF n=1 Tax=Robbsia sp. KACC 23696 TaxID=3149231 RepID=UPI00325C0B5F